MAYEEKEKFFDSKLDSLQFDSNDIKKEVFNKTLKVVLVVWTLVTLYSAFKYISVPLSLSAVDLFVAVKELFNLFVAVDLFVAEKFKSFLVGGICILIFIMYQSVSVIVRCAELLSTKQSLSDVELKALALQFRKIEKMMIVSVSGLLACLLLSLPLSAYKVMFAFPEGFEPDTAATSTLILSFFGTMLFFCNTFTARLFLPEKLTSIFKGPENKEFLEQVLSATGNNSENRAESYPQSDWFCITTYLEMYQYLIYEKFVDKTTCPKFKEFQVKNSHISSKKEMSND